ncbi:MAG: PAS domain-containing protein [Acidobacteria bacterium]|nr:PAS domain-containing protein [Acidobacteriota bacterium]
MSVRKAVSRAWRHDLQVSAAAAALTVILSFLVFAGIEESFVRREESRRLLHYVRGISTSMMAALAVGLTGYRQHRVRERTLREEAERAERDARDVRALLGFIVDATPAALVVLDTEYRVVRTNRVAEEVHGAGLTGKPCREAVGACSTLCSDCPAMRSFQTGEPCTGLPPHTDPRTGEVLSVESYPLDLPDGQRHVLLVEQIVTEQKKLQARLLHQEKMAAFGLLAAGIAHDLGNPLASIDAQVQLLDCKNLDGGAASILREVRRELGRLGRTLRELVDFARRRRDEAALVSVQAVAEDALRILRHDPRMRNVTVSSSYDPETPPVLIVEDHLMQVVFNLLLNAVDAMPEGGSLGLELAPAGSLVALRVHDTGCGMDRAVLNRCFEPLFTTKPPGKGTGLGLSISRDIIREGGGRLELHSSEGRGTTAVVSLPAAGQAVAASGQGRAA